jgi:hypothetical protein
VRTSNKCGEVGKAGDCMQASQNAVMTLLDCNIEMMLMMMAAKNKKKKTKKKKTKKTKKTKDSLTSRGAVLLET